MTLADSERGDTLIEVLIALALVGIVATGIVGAMMTATAGSGSHQDEALAQTLAVTAAEQVKSANYIACAQPSAYQSAAQSAFKVSNFPANWTAAGTITIPTVMYWSPSLADFSSATSDCIDNSVSSGGLQRIQVQVSSPDQKATESVWLIKRKSS